MKFDSLTARFFRFGLTASMFCLSALLVFGQTKAENKMKDKGFCQNYNYSDDNRASYKEEREITVPAGSLNVDGKRNGGIRVRGENRSDILIRACIQTTGGSDEEAQSLAKSIRIETGGTIQATGADDEKHFAVSYEILVPRNTNMSLTAHNGGIGISSVEGTIEFTTLNGGVSLKDVAGNVKGKTTNGGVNVALTGNAWRGSGLDVQTTNGGVNLQMSENYQARVEAGTVNGGFRSDISGLSIPADNDEYGRRRNKRISTDLNGGGAPIRVVTTNGGIRINSIAEKTM